ncbi:survival motor neuron protein-like [Bombus huntii]|uniref:survival motor neuron protein-like n=1 Tax=Bombus huntii TaxID=85661 RepID=UPI0021A9B4B8|nr:survival motor neuron protein-like [Bombus huntii]
MGLLYTKAGSLETFSDADYAGDKEARKSTSGVVCKYANAAITWQCYGNTEKVELSSLLESEGLQSQIAQQKKALEEKFNEENDETSNAYKHHFIPGPSFNSMTDIMPPASPLPPQLMAKLSDNDTDALSSMLMSWYISGYMVYYTGYYHGLKQARNNQENRKNC